MTTTTTSPPDQPHSSPIDIEESFATALDEFFPKSNILSGENKINFRKTKFHNYSRIHRAKHVYDQVASGTFGKYNYVVHQRTIRIREFLNSSSSLEKQGYRIINEIIAMTFFCHRNILQSYQTEMDQKNDLKLRIYCETANTLEKLAKNRDFQFEMESVGFMLHCVFRALAYLEKLNIVHNCVDENSVYVTHAGDVKLGNFTTAGIKERIDFEIENVIEDADSYSVSSPLSPESKTSPLDSTTGRVYPSFVSDVFAAGFLGVYLLSGYTLYQKMVIIDNPYMGRLVYKLRQQHGSDEPICDFVARACKLHNPVTAAELVDGPDPDPFIAVEDYEIARQKFIDDSQLRRSKRLLALRNTYRIHSAHPNVSDIAFHYRCQQNLLEYVPAPLPKITGYMSTGNDGRKLRTGHTGVYLIEFAYNFNERKTIYVAKLDFDKRNLLYSLVYEIFSSQDRPMIITDMLKSFAHAKCLMEETHDSYLHSAQMANGKYNKKETVCLPNYAGDYTRVLKIDITLIISEVK